jgi:hypothetical protein
MKFRGTLFPDGVPSAPQVLQSSHKKLLMASGLVKVPLSFVLPVSCNHRSVKGAMLKELLTIELIEVCHNLLCLFSTMASFGDA